jgi:hypothetical protein
MKIIIESFDQINNSDEYSVSQVIVMPEYRLTYMILIIAAVIRVITLLTRSGLMGRHSTHFFREATA